MRFHARKRFAASWIRYARSPSDVCHLTTKELIEKLNPILRGWATTGRRLTSESSSTG